VATVQAMLPFSALTTNLSLMPNDTWRLVDPALQVSPSSAHFEKPLGQSAAKAGAVNRIATALQISVLWFMTCLVC